MFVSKVYIPHAAKRILNLDIAELLVSVRLDLLQKLALRRQDPLEGSLEIRLRGG